jgi:hypothetical protein
VILLLQLLDALCLLAVLNLVLPEGRAHLVDSLVEIADVQLLADVSE